jgi:Carboxypeptidase regulatory-like domain
MRNYKRFAFLLVLFSATVVVASITGTISGIVTDPGGAVVPGAEITATNVQTGVAQTVTTDAKGFYSFPALAIGTYTVRVRHQGFKDFEQLNITIDANSSVRADAQLEVGAVVEQVTVSSTAVRVETTSTQMGEVITGQSMTSIPLNGRSYTDLLALQPGVVPQSTHEYDAGFNPSGDLNPGNLSVSGMRESANGFMVNGGDVEEGGNMGAAVIPNLDSIAEFRILTNNFDAEYGNYMGGLINVVTKSGTNQIHGDGFEFLRFPNLDARNYFSPTRAALHRNQFGGTVGGPIVHNKIFFFADYQGTRQIAGQDSGIIPVLSAADRQGNLSDLAASDAFATPETQANGTTIFIPNTVSSFAGTNPWATTLSQELGYPVSAGEPYYFLATDINPNTNTPYGVNCTSSTQCVFPNGLMNANNGQAISAPAKALLSYIPQPNVFGAQCPSPTGCFSSSAFAQTLRDDKVGFRLDAPNTKWGGLSAYYFLDDFTFASPYLGATLPGFATTTFGRSQQVNVSDTKTFSSTAVNEFRINYMREATNPEPTGGIGPKTGSFGIPTGANTLGLVVLAPSLEGVPSVTTNEFSLGVNPFTEYQVNNTAQILDNFTKVIGTHTLKFGAGFHLSQIAIYDRGANNGTWSFDGSETGNDFADLLLGASNNYLQGSQVPMYTTSRYFGIYGQDSWRARSNLILNYGLRWEVTTPWYEKHNEIETIVPGLQSRVFPGAPEGWVFPGDPGIPKTLAPVRYNNFGPRIGIAYSPAPQGGLLRRLLGPSGNSSIRAGYGMFYTAFEDATSFNEVGDAPFGYFYSSPQPTLFSTPFVDRSTGDPEGQRFPVPFPPLNTGPAHPDTSINWAQFLPISSSPGFYYKNRVPYSEDYMLSLQRQFGGNTVLSMSYVGTQGHRLLADLESNPGDPKLCLSLASQGCGPFAEDGSFTLPSGQQIESARTVFQNGLGSNGLFVTMANSGYNALEVSLRHSSNRAALEVAYTYSKAMDNASSWGPGISDAGEQINPINPRLSRSLSAFDLTHNFVVSYSYMLPFDRLFSANKLTRGWMVTGITRYATGFPVTINEQDDNSLLGTFCTGPTCSVVDTPNFTPGPLNFTNPRSGKPYFNISLFSPESIGQLGDSNRRFFHGPGQATWDFGLVKDLPFTEVKKLEFRAEFFNLFNHANFDLPQGDIINSSFGFVTSASDPRIGQLAVKFLF